MANDKLEEEPAVKKDLVSPVSFSCKVIPNTEELPRSSKQWTRAKRDTLTLDGKSLSCNALSVDYAEIEKAELHIYQSALFFEYAILTVETAQGCHHFGLKYSEFWQGDLPFTVERIEENSPFILFRKILMICILIYIFWEVVKR